MNAAEVWRLQSREDPGLGCRGFSLGPRHLDFLRPTRPCISAPQIPGFWTVGFIWNSLESLVRNEPFQWDTGDPGAIVFMRGVLPPGKRPPSAPSASIRSSAAPMRLGKRKRPGAPEIMAVGIETIRSGIRVRLRQFSLFCKELSIPYHFMKITTRQSFLRIAGARFWSPSPIVRPRTSHRHPCGRYWQDRGRTPRQVLGCATG